MEKGPRLRTTTGALIGLSSLVPDECEHCGAALPLSGDTCQRCGRKCCLNEPLRLKELFDAKGPIPSISVQPKQAASQDSGAAAPGVPQLIQLGKKSAARNEWQVMPCPVCGPMCHTTNHFGDPVERLATATEKAYAAVRKGAWGKVRPPLTAKSHPELFIRVHHPELFIRVRLACPLCTHLARTPRCLARLPKYG